MSHDFDEVNKILAEMVDDGMVEPIDDSTLEINFWDWADIVGVVDDFAPAYMVDEKGETWIVE